MDEKRLKSVPLFASMGKKDRRMLAQHADEVDVPEGKRLVSEGEMSWSFFVIEEGTAAVNRGDEHLADLGPDDFFGEIGILESKARNATVTATSAMELIVMDSTALHALRRNQPEVADRLREAIDARVSS